jgi:hypothetical protein
MKCKSSSMRIKPDKAHIRKGKYKEKTHYVLGGLRGKPAEEEIECPQQAFRDLLDAIASSDPLPTGIRAYFAIYVRTDTNDDGNNDYFTPEKEKSLAVVFVPDDIPGNYFLINELGFYNLPETVFRRWTDHYAGQIANKLGQILSLPNGETISIWYPLHSITELREEIICLTTHPTHPQHLKEIVISFAVYADDETVKDDGRYYKVGNQLCLTYILKLESGAFVEPILLFGDSNYDTGLPCPPAHC